MEGLSTSFKRVVSDSVFEGFKVDKVIKVTHLQYVDDRMLIRVPLVYNL